MMQVTKFKAHHLRDLALQPSQQEFHAQFSMPGYGSALEACPYSFTGMVDGRVIACAGIHEVWAGRAVAWALLSIEAGRHLRAIHRAADGFIQQAAWRRIECQVEEGFEAGHRWARMLGMHPEGLMQGYSPNGTNFYLYARINHG